MRICVTLCAAALSASALSADVLKVSSLGWNREDSTGFIQAALDSGAATVVVDRVDGPWVTRPLFARSNQTVVFEKGVVLLAKKGEFKGLNDRLFSCMGVTNVVIRGYGAVWRMHRADYDAEPYRRGEWRHSLAICGCSNVTVEGLTLLESGGDGVYVSTLGRETDRPPTDIVLRDLVCDRHYRQGVSVISARRLIIERCVMKNTGGTPPAAGIDFEPNVAGEELTDCVMRDCTIEDNAGIGIELCLMQMDATSKPVSITVENCRVRGNTRSVSLNTWSKPTFPTGFVRMRGCVFADARDYALYVQRKPLSSVSLEFERCEFVNAHTAAKDATKVTDIGLILHGWKDPTTDGIRFDDCVVRQPVAREWISTTTPTLVGEQIKAITGSVTVKSPSGERRIVLDEKWRGSHFKRVFEGEMPPYRLFDVASAAAVALPPAATLSRLAPMNVRDKAAYRFYASAPGRVRLVGRQHLLGRRIPTKGQMTIADATGKKVASYPIFGEKEDEIVFDAPSAGYYLLTVAIKKNAIRLCAANVPVAIEVPEGGVNLISSAGRLYFRKAAGERAALLVRGSVPERIRAMVSDPGGRVVWERDNIGEWTAFAAAADAAAGLWSLDLKPPTAAPFEDCNILVRGIAPELFLSPVYSAKPDVVASVVSPDGRNEIRLRLNPLSYEVLRDGRTVVGRSDIRLDVHGAKLEASTPVISSSRLSGRVKTPFYKKAEVSLDGCETLADFGRCAVRLVARDDGVAYRFETKMGGRIRIGGERADVTVPDPGAVCWANYTTRVGCEETLCRTVLAQDVPTACDDERMVYLPFAYSANGATVVVTESDVRDYPIWNLGKGDVAQGVCLAGCFAGWPLRECHSDGPANRFVSGGRRVVVDEHAEWLVETDGTRTCPWRVFALADARYPAKLVESDIVYALAPAADEGADFSWVKPGKVAWDWWNAWEGKGVTNCTTDTYFRYVDFASENGIEYVILDEGWSAKLDIWRDNPAMDVPAIIRHGREKGVGIILWMAWAQVVGDEERVASHFARMGAAGFKIDFLDRGDAGVARFMEKFAAVCAKARMVVAYHGAYRPTGLHRRYPNVLNYEAIYGLEKMKTNSGDARILDNDVKAAFVRMTAGPLDYTPGAMDNYKIGWYPPKDVSRSNPGSVGTRSRQMALMALYEAPLQMLCDSPTKYRRNPESLAFMAATPVTWDETRGIGGAPDSFVVLARRKGSVWYVAGVTNADGRACDFDTSFLGGGEWLMESFRDNLQQGGMEGDATACLHETTSVRAGEKLSFRMASGGGFVARFTAK